MKGRCYSSTYGVNNKIALFVKFVDYAVNQKDTISVFNKVECALKIKNLENGPVELNPLFRCYRLSSPQTAKIIKGGVDAIPSQGIKEFTISFDNKDREWSCEIEDFGVKNFN